MPVAHDVTTEEIEYLRHGERPLGLKLFRPSGKGPFPLVIDLHGGAWTKGDPSECDDRAAVLARSGIAVAALSFRHAADGYPTSLVDINYATRWAKANAERLGTRPDMIGLCGQSSGGHLGMLSAMRPADPRYAAIALPAGSPAVDATVRCVGMLWPVINPLSRYRHALRLRAGANPPGWTADIPERHDIYWGTEAKMAEGNPMLALEQGETVKTPPALWLQGRPDEVHDYRDPESAAGLNEPERFAANYRQAGGEIEIRYIEQATRSSTPTYELLIPFFRKHLAGGAS